MPGVFIEDVASNYFTTTPSFLAAQRRNSATTPLNDMDYLSIDFAQKMAFSNQSSLGNQDIPLIDQNDLALLANNDSPASFHSSLLLLSLGICGGDSRSSCSTDGGADYAALNEPTPYEIMQMTAAQSRKSQNITECVPVPSSEHVAETVGRQGCKIKALRAKTNTYIKTPVRGEDSVFVVTGRKEDVEAAKQEILSAAEHFTQIRASRRHSQGGAPAPGHVTAYVRVPYKFVGLVVGPKGATIKRVQQQTHTYIVTPSRDKEPVFEVTGLADNVEAARREIEAHIGNRTGCNATLAPSFGNSTGNATTTVYYVRNGAGDESLTPTLDANITHYSRGGDDSTVSLMQSYGNNTVSVNGGTVSIQAPSFGANTFRSRNDAELALEDFRSNGVDVPTTTDSSFGHHYRSDNSGESSVVSSLSSTGQQVPFFFGSSSAPCGPLAYKSHHQLVPGNLTGSIGDPHGGSISDDSQMHIGYNAWSTSSNQAYTMTGDCNASSRPRLNKSGGCSSEPDEGVWSLSNGAGSSNSPGVQHQDIGLNSGPCPMLPSFLSFFWSDLDDLNDFRASAPQQKRSASISVVEGENYGSWFRKVSNQQSGLPTSWPSINVLSQRPSNDDDSTTLGRSGDELNNNDQLSVLGVAGAQAMPRTTTAPFLFQRQGSSSSPLKLGPSVLGSGVESMASVKDVTSNIGPSLCQVCQTAPANASMGSACNHSAAFCTVCVARLLQMPKPLCPLCRAPAVTVASITSRND